MAASSSSGGEHHQAEKRPKLEPIVKCAEQHVNESTELDVGKWSTLDEHLEEKIIARLPFKKLFQAASLSKAWRLNFWSPAFEREVQSACSSWGSYAPVFQTKEKGLVGYERCSKHWHILPADTYIQADMRQGWWLRAAHGPLLCWCTRGPDLHGIICVTNPLTRSFRELPRPGMHLFFEVVHIVCDEGKKTYSVILGKLIRSHARTFIEVEIFQSASGTWNVEHYDTLVHNKFVNWGESAIVQGVLYMVLSNEGERTGYDLISLDVKQKIWKKIPMLNDIQISDVVNCSGLVVLGLEVMFVIGHGGKGWENPRKFSVFKLDLASRSAIELSRASAKLLHNLPLHSRDSCEDDCIYIVETTPFHRAFNYKCETTPFNRSFGFDLRSKVWKWIPSPSESLGIPLSLVGDGGLWAPRTISYEPGLCPFFEL